MEQLVCKDLALKNEHFLTYQVSLDGLEETHDRLRRMKGSFQKILRNLKRLVELQREHPYFRVVVLTNVNRGNYRDIEPLADLLWNEVGVEHTYDLVRGVSFSAWGIPEDIVVQEDPRDCDLPPVDELDSILEVIQRVNAREGHRFDQCMRQLEIQVRMYQRRPSPIRCLSAGRTLGVIYSDGSVAACEFTQPFAHLRDFSYDLGALWHSAAADERRSRIRSCSCAHSCFVLTSLQEWEEQRAAQPAPA
jgi:MoaA/NifB/PqqE/SkfB family radical SAM enzyme